MSTPPYSTIALDVDTWDLTVDANGNIAVNTPPLAVAQDVASAIRTFEGEVYYDTSQGIPYWTKVLGKLPPSSLLIEMMNSEAKARVDGVSSVQTVISGFTDRATTGTVYIVDDNNVSSSVTF